MDTGKIKDNTDRMVIHTIDTINAMLTSLKLEMLKIQQVMDLGLVIPELVEDEEIREIARYHKEGMDFLDDLMNYLQTKKEGYRSDKPKS